MAAVQSSFVESAGLPNQDFSLQNLPLGVAVVPASKASSSTTAVPRICTRIGDSVVDLAALSECGLLTGPILSKKEASTTLTGEDTLNAFANLGPSARKELRSTLQRLLSKEEGCLRDDVKVRGRVFHDAKDVSMQMPMAVGDYTDFYASKEHASNVGTMFGRDPPLLGNWGNLPVGYHGRASSVVVSGTPITRPRGLVLPKGSDSPVYSQCKVLDYELEMGFFLGTGNDLGTTITCDDARKHILGLVLVNDWSARDIQKYEYIPLGPFTAKNFATSVSPWIVTLEALEPFSEIAPEQTLATVSDYLSHSSPGRKRMTYDIKLEVGLSCGEVETIVTKSNFKHLYWTMDQMLAHHTVTGCNARCGDLIATGTITGSREDPMSFGSLLEKSWAGSKPFQLENGETRTYLNDGDKVTLRGFCCGGDGNAPRVGFGECTGVVLPSPEANV